MNQTIRFPKKIIGLRHKIIDWASNKIFDLQSDIKLGEELLQKGHFEKARIVFQKCVEKFPIKPQGYEGLSAVAIKTWEWDNAEKWLNISINKTKAKSSYLRKAILLVNHAQFTEGFNVMDEVIKLYGAEMDTLLFKAELLFKPKRFLEAVDLLKALNKKTTTQILLARALIGDKKFEEANKIIEILPAARKPLKTQEEKMINLLTCWQKHYLAGADLNKPKIFGIGLSRTATTSLTTALEILGLTAIHFINPLTYQVIDIEDFLYYDAFCDSPVSFRFEELYSLFPNAKFIYTERNLPDWVRSSSNLYRPRGFSTTKELQAWLKKNDGGKFEKLYHNFDPIYQKSYGSLYADFPDWESAYLAFENRVYDFFSDKPKNKLLRINICDEPGWEKLCGFLNVPVPDVPFPHSNTVMAREKSI